MKNQQSKKSLAYKPIIYGMFSNVILAVAKIVAGSIGNSHALVADGIHSASDLITDFIALIASKFSKHAADAEHPYGHGKIETLATTVIAASLLLVAFSIIYDAAINLYTAASLNFSWLLILVCLLSIAIKEALYVYTVKIAKLIGSDLLLINAWHHRSDAASSIVVLLSIIGNSYGFTYLDSLSAMVIGILIIKMAVEIGWVSIKELIDTSIDQEELDKISKLIRSTQGVLAINNLRGRSSAGDIILDVHITVGKLLSVSEGHYIGDQVTMKVKQQFPRVIDIIIHIDPETDTLRSMQLPSRAAILACINEDEQLRKQQHELQLHYLDSKVHIMIYCNVNVSDDLANRYRQAFKRLVQVGEVRVYGVPY